jgi:Family of unknown function (DUF5335)
MATERSLPRAEWTGFFNLMSKSLLGQSAEIEVSSLELGDQIVAEWIPMLGITYDAKDDTLDIALDRVDHLIRHPRDIAVQEVAGGLASVAVMDGEGTMQIIRLKAPLALPAAAG